MADNPDQPDQEPATPSRIPGSNDWGEASHPAFAEALQLGDPSAFAWLAQAYREPLLRYARRNIPPSSDPEDIVQEALLRIWTNRATLRPTGSIRALLFISVRTIARDEYRKWDRRMERSKGVSEFSADTDPSQDLLLSELETHVEEAVDALSLRRKEVFRLIREKGLTLGEVGKHLHLQERTVKNTMTSALKELRQKLGLLRD